MTSTSLDQGVLFSLMTLVDNHKEELTEGEYIKVCNGLKACYSYYKWHYSSASNHMIVVSNIDNNNNNNNNNVSVRKKLFKGLKILFWVGQIQCILQEITKQTKKKIENKTRHI